MRKSIPLPLAALLLVAGLTAVPALPAEQTAVIDLNSAGEKEIAALPGVSDELARRIVAHRREHGPFASIEQVHELPGMTGRIWSAIEERVRVLPPLEEGPPAPAGVAPSIVAVANYFVEFKGIDLTKLPPKIRKEFLDEANAESCPCGCTGDTIARCAVNDPGCAVAPARLKTLYKQHRERAEAEAKASKP